MNCPRCETELSEIKVDEIVLDKCPSCAGIWFDFAELERVLGKDPHWLRELTRGRKHAASPASPSSEKAQCPRCGEGRLVEVRSSQDPDVTVLGCLVCYGRWLDGHELERFKQKGLFGKMRLLFRQLW